MRSGKARRNNAPPQPGVIIVFAAGLAFACLAVAAINRLHRKSTHVQGSQTAIAGDECEISECGPDGVPLSLYAG